MRSRSFRYVNSKFLAGLCLLTAMQQALNAFGTYALIQAGTQLGEGVRFFYWVLAALISFLAGYVFPLLVRPLETQLTFSAYRTFLSEKVLTNSGKPSIWAQKIKKEQYLASIGTEAESYLSALIFVVFDMLTYSFALLFGMLVLGVAIDISFVPAFLLSGLCSFAVYQLLQSKISIKSEEEQEARSELGRFLLHSWENVFFKNKNVVSRYLNGLSEHHEAAKSKAVTSALWSAGFVTILSVASALPVFAVVVSLVWKNMNSASVLASLLVTIPRQMNLLSTFTNLFQASASFIAFESKFKKLDENSAVMSESLLQRISFDDLYLQGGDGDILKTLEAATSGRFTLRGRNGAGKSTLLLHLNSVLDNSFYLPTNPQFIAIDDFKNESSGEKLMRHLKEIECSGAPFILVDEWDANLDFVNMNLADEYLNKLSQKAVVVEVRHRRE